MATALARQVVRSHWIHFRDLGLKNHPIAVPVRLPGGFPAPLACHSLTAAPGISLGRFYLDLVYINTTCHQAYKTRSYVILYQAICKIKIKIMLTYYGRSYDNSALEDIKQDPGKHLKGVVRKSPGRG